jgi:hypothetical protein
MTTKMAYFKAATDLDNHHVLDWVISVFSLTQGPGQEAYPLMVSCDQLGYYYTDQQGALIKIEDAKPGEPLFDYREVIDLPAGMIANLTQDVQTTYGEWLSNLLLLVYPFGSKVAYMNTPMGVGAIEKIMLKNFMNDPVPPETHKAGEFYVSEYIKLSKAVFYMNSLSQLFTIGATRKTITPPPGLKEFKHQMLQKYAGKLGDAVAVSNMEQEIIEFDAKWREGDVGNRFLNVNQNKLVNVSRKRRFLIYGGETGADENSSKVNLLTTSLYDGWDMEQFPAMCTTSRLGSYSRGAETMLGGVEVKWLLRASSNLSVSKEDCGATIGIPTAVTENNIKRLVGFSILYTGKKIDITEESDAGAYLGKLVMVRSPMYCKAGKTDYCNVCVGKRLAATPNALSAAVAACGQTFLMVSLAAAHSRSLSTKKMNLATDLL